MRRKLRMLIAVLTLLLCPAVFADAESLLIVSDLHLTASGDHDAMLDAICSKAPGHDAVLLLGDAANSGRPAEHQRFRAFLERLRAEGQPQVFVLPGNHDLSSGFSALDFAVYYDDYGYAQAFSRDASTASYAVRTAGGVCLLMLDTNGYDEQAQAAYHGRVHPSTLGWLEEVLSGMPEDMPLVVCGHYPILPFTGSGNDDVTNAEALGRLLNRHSARPYLCGHRHSNYTLYADGLRQITVGTPFSWPAWAGVLETGQDGFDYRVQPLYPEGSPEYTRLREEALSLGQRMASGSLTGTSYEGDAEAMAWFMRVYTASLDGDLPLRRETLLSDENCEKWRKAEVRSMVKPWILSLLENPQEDVRRVHIP